MCLETFAEFRRHYSSDVPAKKLNNKRFTEQEIIFRMKYVPGKDALVVLYRKQNRKNYLWYDVVFKATEVKASDALKKIVGNMNYRIREHESLLSYLEA